MQGPQPLAVIFWRCPLVAVWPEAKLSTCSHLRSIDHSNCLLLGGWGIEDKCPPGLRRSLTKSRWVTKGGC